jgi:hypothetical protein
MEKLLHLLSFSCLNQIWELQKLKIKIWFSFIFLRIIHSTLTS